jgi:hypothetical protein
MLEDRFADGRSEYGMRGRSWNPYAGGVSARRPQISRFGGTIVQKLRQQPLRHRRSVVACTQELQSACLNLELRVNPKDMSWSFREDHNVWNALADVFTNFID